MGSSSMNGGYFHTPYVSSNSKDPRLTNPKIRSAELLAKDDSGATEPINNSSQMVISQLRLAASRFIFGNILGLGHGASRL